MGFDTVDRSARCAGEGEEEAPVEGTRVDRVTGEQVVFVGENRGEFLDFGEFEDLKS